MVLKGFSYSKLTELQVQGARDRSCRQIESSQWTNRLSQAQRKWKAVLLGEGGGGRQRQQDTEQGDISSFRQAIVDVYEKDPVREISPIMAARLADLCRQEFRTGQHEKGLEQLYQQQREMTNYLCKEMDQSEKEKNSIQQELEQKIATMKREIETLKRQKAEELRANLEWKKKELSKVRDDIVQKIEELEKKDWSQVQEPVLIKKCIDGTEWVDIDEDYFPAKGPSSGWVLCS